MAKPIDNLPPIHPGKILKDEIEARGLTVEDFDFALRVFGCNSVLNKLIAGEIGISVWLSHKLGQVFGTSGDYWLNLQANYDAKMQLHTRVVGRYI